MQDQLTQILLPSKIGIEIPTYTTEEMFKEQGYTEFVDLSSILTTEEKQFVSSLGSKLGMMFLESDTSKVIVPMKTITSTGVREMRIPQGFSARTSTVSGQRGLIGFPAVSGG